MTREQFEAWAKNQHLDPDHKEKDAWGRDMYSPHIHSMWCGWQAGIKSYVETAVSELTGTPYVMPAREAQPVEPVAWMDNDGNISDNNHYKTFNIPLYTAPPATAEALKLALEALELHQEYGSPTLLAGAKAIAAIAAIKEVM